MQAHGRFVGTVRGIPIAGKDGIGHEEKKGEVVSLRPQRLHEGVQQEAQAPELVG